MTTLAEKKQRAYDEGRKHALNGGKRTEGPSDGVMASAWLGGFDSANRPLTLVEKKQRAAEIEKELAALHEQRMTLRAELAPLEQEIACEETGFNIGDTVEWGFGKGVPPKKGVVHAVWANGAELQELNVRRTLQNGKPGSMARVVGWEKPVIVARKATV